LTRKAAGRRHAAPRTRTRPAQRWSGSGSAPLTGTPRPRSGPVAFKAIQAQHADVHQDDVRPRADGEIDGGRTIVGLTHHADSRPRRPGSLRTRAPATSGWSSAQQDPDHAARRPRLPGRRTRLTVVGPARKTSRRWQWARFAHPAAGQPRRPPVWSGRCGPSSTISRRDRHTRDWPPP